MQRLLVLLVLGAIAFTLNGCSSSNTTSTSETSTESTTIEQTENTESTPNNKVLTVYFSWASNVENNNVDGISSASIVNGNYHVVADYVQKATNSDVFEIKTQESYPADYNQTVNIASEEKKESKRPVVTNHIDNINDYDTIVLVYPNWWGTYPMAVTSFLEEYDFSNKTILPVCTNEGSGMGTSEKDLSALLPNAQVKGGLAISGGSVENSENEVTQWLNDNGVI